MSSALLLTAVAWMWFAVSGCTPLAGIGNGEPTQTYVLTIEAPPRPANVATGPVLLVSRPQAWPGYDGRGIAYVRQPLRLDYYARNEWADLPMRLIEPLLVQALEASPRFSAIVSVNSGVNADLRLDTELMALRQEFFTNPSLGRVAIRAQLVDLGHDRIRATRTFDAAAPAATEDPFGGVGAINKALAQVLDQIVRFCAEASVKPAD